MTNIDWAKPSPGTWESDRSHQSRPFGRFMDDAILESTNRGFAEGFASSGIPLRTIEPAIINGWYYMCVRPLGGPPEPKGPPPKLAMQLMFKLHPELRRRHKRAAAFFEERVWDRETQDWFDRLRAPHVERLMRLAATDPHDLTDQALAAHLSDVARVLRDVTFHHFRGVPAGAIPLGDYLVHSERWGIAPADAMRAVAGFTSATTEPVANLDRIVHALRGDNAIDLLDGATAQATLQNMRDHGGLVTDELLTYELTYGQRATTDYSVFGETLNELPEVVVESLRRRARASSSGTDARERAVEAEHALRQQVPDVHRDQWNSMLEAARTGFSRREDEGDLLLRATGLARLALLEIGRRLVARDRLDEAETALDLTEAEVLAIMAGDGPSREDAARHTYQRRQFTTLEPPARIGEEGSPPPLEVFPPAVARIVEAMFAFVSRFDPEGDPIKGEGLAGHGVSPGIVQGRATIVRDAADFARFAAGDVLIAPMTTPAFNVLLAAASGVVTETGGLISHAAIVAREFGIPGIVGVADAVQSIPDGALVQVNGDDGTVTVLDANPHVDIAPMAASSEVVIDVTLPDHPGELVGLADAADPTRFGGKASGLSRLVEREVTVPAGIALDVDFTQAIAAGDEQTARQLSSALNELSGPFAVRSSATVEDSTDVSFAGQFTTVLGASTGEEVIAAVREVWESGTAAGVEAYRTRLGLTSPVRMAVVVQQLVDANTAGVLFFDPRTDEQVVEASWGFGETVVDGSLSPDRYRIDAAGREISVDVGDKRVELARTGDVLLRRDVESERALRRCLTAEQLVTLANLGSRVSSIFGDARDVEWAIVDDEVYCLQARPITRVVT